MPLDDRTRTRLVRGFSENVPHNRALGIVIHELSKADGARLELPYDVKLVGNPDTGVLHGGAITSLLDSCSGAAVFASLAYIAPIATLDLRIDYLKPATPGKSVTAHAHCYKLTRSIAFTRAIAYHDDPADPIASSSGTFVLATKVGTAAAKAAEYKR